MATLTPIAPMAPPVIQAWVRQLLDPSLWAMIESADDGQVDVRLTAHRGRVKRYPGVLINAGPQEMVSPESLA